MMKKYYLIILFVFAVITAQAQFVGEVSVTRKVLCERNGSLHLVLDIQIGGKAVTPSQSWMIIPELSTADRKSVKIFPHVLINGRRQRQQLERRRRLSGKYWMERQPWQTINVNGRTDEHLTYEMTVPYEAWMCDATLVLRQILTDGNNYRHIFTVDVNGAVDRE